MSFIYFFNEKLFNDIIGIMKNSTQNIIFPLYIFKIILFLS